MKFALWISVGSRKLKLLTNKRRGHWGFMSPGRPGRFLLGFNNQHQIVSCLCIRFTEGQTKPAALLFWYSFSLIKLPLKVESWGSGSHGAQKKPPVRKCGERLNIASQSFCSMRRSKSKWLRLTKSRMDVVLPRPVDWGFASVVPCGQKLKGKGVSQWVPTGMDDPSGLRHCPSLLSLLATEIS